MRNIEKIKKMISSLEKIIKHYESDVANYVVKDTEIFLNEQLEEIADKVVKPKTRTNHIGLELEFFSKKSRYEIIKSLVKYKIAKHCILGEDGSLDHHNYSHNQSHELRILMTEKNYKTILKSLQKVIKECKFVVNDTCGLHVHLDMRNRNLESSMTKLFSTIEIMKKLVNRKRLNNYYCQIESLFQHNQSEFPSKRVAINARLAYRERKTIEVRLHEATTDTDKIANWISFLLCVVNKKGTVIDEIDSLDKFKEIFKPGRKTITYLKQKVS